MVGHVRAKGKCPVCDKAFVEIPKLGFLCYEHKTIPRKFYVDLPWKGERVRIFSDTTGQVLDSYDRAEKIRERIESELEDHTFDPSRYVTADAAKFYTENLLDKFEAHKLPSIAPSAEADYRRKIRIARDFFGRRDVRDLRKVDIIDYKEHCEKSFKWSAKTLKDTLAVFKTFLRYVMRDLELVTHIPAFPEIEVTEPPVKWVHSKDQITLYELVPDEDKAIVGFLMLHGCRPGEARALKAKDVDLEAGTITIRSTFSNNVYREKRKGKRAKAYTIAIHPEIFDYIAERVRTSLPDAFLFINPRTGNCYYETALRKIWNKVRIRAGIGVELRLYDASRHSFASQLVNSGVSLFKVSKLLGHSTVKMSEKYSHADIESLRIELPRVTLKRETVTRLSLEPKRRDK